MCALISYGLMWGPAMAFLSHSYGEAGVVQSAGFALMNLTAGIGIIIGSAAGGEIAHKAGDMTTYALAAATCLATFAILSRRLRPAQPGA